MAIDSYNLRSENERKYISEVPLSHVESGVRNRHDVAVHPKCEVLEARHNGYDSKRGECLKYDL